MLMCLPVFLSACSRLLVICGPTYLDRLWCMMEIFVFFEMGSSIEDIELCFIHPDLDHQTGSENRSRLDTVAEFFERRFDNFDVRDAECFDPVQRDQLLAIIEAGFGGLNRFNEALTGPLEKLRDRAMSQIRERESLAGKSFLASVPRGVKPGDQFKVMVNNQQLVVTCPQGTKPGQKVRFST